MIKLVDEYFTQGCGRCSRFATPACATQQWSDGLRLLRDTCLSAGLEETAKWGHPCYTHQGRNIAILGAFRADFRITFFNASLLKDKAKLLLRKGPNSAHSDMLSFTDLAQAQSLQATVHAYLKEAMGLAEVNAKPVKVTGEILLPIELTQVLAEDQELAQAFHKLTPGRQRSYVIQINAAKKVATRLSRIQSHRSRILAGRGANER